MEGPAHGIKPDLGFGGLIGSAEKSGLIRHPPLFSAEKTAESPAGPSAGRKSGLIRQPPLVLIPQYTNNPPPRILITRLLRWP